MHLRPEARERLAQSLEVDGNLEVFLRIAPAQALSRLIYLLPEERDWLVATCHEHNWNLACEWQAAACTIGDSVLMGEMHGRGIRPAMLAALQEELARDPNFELALATGPRQTLRRFAHLNASEIEYVTATLSSPFRLQQCVPGLMASDGSILTGDSCGRVVRPGALWAMRSAVAADPNLAISLSVAPRQTLHQFPYLNRGEIDHITACPGRFVNERARAAALGKWPADEYGDPLPTWSEATGQIAHSPTIHRRIRVGTENFVMMRVLPDARCLVREAHVANDDAVSGLEIFSDEEGIAVLQMHPTVAATEELVVACWDIRGNTATYSLVLEGAADVPVSGRPVPDGPVRPPLDRASALSMSDAELRARKYPRRPGSQAAPDELERWLAHVARPAIESTRRLRASSQKVHRPSTQVNFGLWAGVQVSRKRSVPPWLIITASWFAPPIMDGFSIGDYADQFGIIRLVGNGPSVQPISLSFWVGLGAGDSPVGEPLWQAGQLVSCSLVNQLRMTTYQIWYEVVLGFNLPTHSGNQVATFATQPLGPVVAQGDEVAVSIWFGDASGNVGLGSQPFGLDTFLEYEFLVVGQDGVPVFTHGYAGDQLPAWAFTNPGEISETPSMWASPTSPISYWNYCWAQTTTNGQLAVIPPPLVDSGGGNQCEWLMENMEYSLGGVPNFGQLEVRGCYAGKGGAAFGQYGNFADEWVFMEGFSGMGSWFNYRQDPQFQPPQAVPSNVPTTTLVAPVWTSPSSFQLVWTSAFGPGGILVF